VARKTAAGADPADAPADDVAAMGYEQAREALMDVVRRLEAGTAGLEESLQLWERGEVLAAHCEQWLDGARARLDAALAARDLPDARTAGEPTGA
jgi:exodeoxyribonuclease VII small subunit